jgi:hypothetical protein
MDSLLVRRGPRGQPMVWHHTLYSPKLRLLYRSAAALGERQVYQIAAKTMPIMSRHFLT